MTDIIVKAQNLSMMYNLSRKKEQTLKEYLISIAKGELFFDEFWALRDVSFEIRKGDAVGIIGENGAGKSTLLRLVAGLIKPTRGRIDISGAVAPLIELSGGFDRDLTAKENIYLLGSMQGHSKCEMQKIQDEILDFAELIEFSDVPVRNFSTGMLLRLGFAIATSTPTDILIIDEVLAVGDVSFRQKCEARIAKQKANGTTILLTSHSPSQIKKICNKQILLKNGRIVRQDMLLAGVVYSD